MRKRNHRLSVRYTDAEYDELMKRISSTGQSIQSYLLHSSLGAKLTTETDRELLREEASLLADIDRQLRGIGTNLNQLAHGANLLGYNLDACKINEIACVVVHMRDEANKLWQSRRRSVAHQNRMED
ncbi:plasmid mobilization protein [Butyrivibrio sp. NC2007]|uniref:plasmid mobilization protein n=1 Tax=Butyrivibrio sp. NC2007 TaxID=1280683 RepID=UPI0003B60188|nr:plasmid mobilization relaxosome protein MobC [Butyrivibrio sp. NC2007]